MKVCKVCGKKGIFAYTDICSHECFEDHFWQSKVLMKEAGDISETGMIVARIDGEHRMIGYEDSTSAFRGFAGHEFLVKFIDGPHKGKTYRTTNMWYQGRIPEEYKDKLPDNAIFVKEADDSTELVK